MDHYGDRRGVLWPEEIRKLTYKVQSFGFGWKQPNAAEHYIQRADQGLIYGWNGAYEFIRRMNCVA
jgi:hypothetical protein